MCCASRRGHPETTPASKALVRQYRSPQSVVMPARLILLVVQGAGVHETVRELSIGRTTVQRWRQRWRDSAGQPFAERLCDAPRPGTPPTFTPEQICALIALACEPPSDSGQPLPDLTYPTLAAEAAERRIVESISARASPASSSRWPRERSSSATRAIGSSFISSHKHASWLNQIELWFSILARKVIRRGNFTSVDHLPQKIRTFIAFFNKTMAKPFRWTYTDKPLAA
jgi:transposase-like protein